MVQSVTAGRVGSFVIGLDRQTIALDDPLSFVGSGAVLSSQRVFRRQETVPPNRHTMKHWSLLIFYQRDLNARAKTALQDICVVLDTLLDALLNKARHGADHRKTQDALELPPPLPLPPQPVPRGGAQRKTVGPGDRVSPCQTRHSGRSIDRAGKFRTLDEVRQRGAWTSMQTTMQFWHVQEWGSKKPPVVSWSVSDTHKRMPGQFTVEIAASRDSVCTAVSKIRRHVNSVSDPCLPPSANRVPSAG